MAVTLTPFGKLADGKHGFAIADGTRTPLAAVIEVLASLPATNSTDNFPGRMIFETATQTVYTFRNSPENQWRALDGLAVTIGSGEPSVSPTPASGELYFDQDTQVLSLFDGVVWLQVGGRYAASIVERQYVGDGTTVLFATGAADMLDATDIEVFWDAARQYQPSDYVSVGNNVSFTTAPPNGVKVLIRSFVSGAVVQNAQLYNMEYDGDGVTTQFDTGMQGAPSSNIFVYEDGKLVREDTRYTIVSQNATITALTRSSTTATATTQVAHGLGIGATVTIAGASPSVWNASYTVTAVPNSVQFQFSVSSSLTTPATADPAIYYSPVVQNDRVQFLSAPANGIAVDIRTIKSAVGDPIEGEVNTASNVGSGVGVFAGKAGTDLQFRSFINGQNTSVVQVGNSIRVDVNSQNVFSNRVTVSMANYSLQSNVSEVEVANTSFPVVIDLSGIPVDSSEAGRQLLVGDESGGASVNNITITAGGTVQINGSTAPISITTDYGYVRLEYNGSAWFIRGQG